MKNNETNNHPRKGSISLIDKIGSLCVLFSSLFLINLSATPILKFYRGDLQIDISALIPDIILLIIGIIALRIGIRLMKKSILFEQLLDLGFEEGIYSRLAPVVSEIAKAQAELKDVHERLDTMNLNIDNLRKRSVEIKVGDSSAFGVDISAQVSRFLRLVLLMNASLGAFIYLLYFTRESTPTILTFLFIIWWLEITSDFNLWNKSSAYIWVFFPILTIPITAILSAIIFGHDLLIGLMMLTLVVYSISYYTWSRYVVEGMLPFNINVVLSEFQKSDSKSIKIITKLGRKKSVVSSVFFRHRLQIQKGSIILSLILFIIAVFAFLVDNTLIPISWKQSHLPGFMASFDSQILAGLASLILFILWRKSKNFDDEIRNDLIDSEI